MLLENFIYSETKDLFIAQLEAGNVLDEAIVFIEDTKEIWNHGTYFNCAEFDISNLVTKDELTEALSTKQDTISDIDTIRTNASKGATAVQPAAISDMETKTNAAATYATKSEVTTGLNGKIAQNGTVTAVIALTQAEYDALTTKDATTLYIITDA